MSANVPLSIRIAAIFDNKGLKQADKGISKLSSSAKKLGVSLAAAFSVRSIVNFGKASVRASLQAQAEQDRLNQLLTVGVGATASQVAALNDQASALEKLGVVTAGNITQTQSQLATFNLQTSTIEALTPAILDYVTAEKGATASTSDFKQMTNGLAQALNGNFSSLTRVGFVIDENTKKQIKSGNESERAQAIIEVLNSTYKDFNKNLRATPAGQMQVLANAAEDAQTIIGTGLIDALSLLAGEGNTVEPLAQSMSEFSIYVADAIVGTALLIEKLKEIPGLGSQNAITRNNFLLNPSTTALAIIKKGVDYVRQLGKEFREPGMGGYPSSALGPGYVDPNELAAKRRMAAEKAAAKLQKQILANDNKRLKSEKARAALAKAQLALGRASKTLDLERISIEAALKGQISETDRLSLLLQKSILDENASLATQLAKQLESTIRRQNELNALLLATPEAPNPYRNWKPPTFVGPVMIEGGTAPQNPLKIPYGEPVPNFNVPSYMTSDSGMGGLQANDYLRLGALGGNVADTIVNVEVNLDGATVGGAIRDTSVNDSLSGSFNTVNRFARFQQGMAP
jgi:hypothetical protein